MDVATDAAGLFATSCAPAILPDETVYSWCARFHRLNGGGNVQATSQLLFGHRTAGLRNDFPFHLAHLHELTRGGVGTLSDLLMRGTLYGFRAPFLPPHARDDIRRYLLYGGRSGEIHRTLGLSRAGLGLTNRLKFCADCVSEQQRQLGFAWWIASHQPPFSFSCRAHYQWLRLGDISLRPGLTDTYCLPELLASVSVANGLHGRMSRCSQLIRLDKWGNYISQQENLQLAGELLRQTYRLQAKTRRWVTFDGYIRPQQLRDAFLAYYGDILQLFPKRFLGDLAGVNGGFLATLLTKNSPLHHPMKHLLLLSFLFETPEDFMAVQAKVMAVHASGGDLAVRSLLRDRAAC
ncbi:TnsD family Tn7-like transposition protein [Paraburkholderia sp. DD10]|uniref:TnsD family Tn7-like transposition protein n=1 Tax=Paraburkholderia sp. DD10 TaxID=3409691 RepID=UPI003BA13605